MSNVEGENPEFDDLDLGELGAGQPDETLQFDQPGALPELEPSEDPLLAGETMDQGETGELVQPAEQEVADLDGLAPVEVKTDEEEPPGEEPPEEEEEEKEKGPGLLARLTKTSPYVVLLGISLVAILIGILCLWLELRSYDSQIKPPQVGAATVVHSGPPGTTATA